MTHFWLKNSEHLAKIYYFFFKLRIAIFILTPKAVLALKILSFSYTVPGKMRIKYFVVQKLLKMSTNNESLCIMPEI